MQLRRQFKEQELNIPTEAKSVKWKQVGPHTRAGFNSKDLQQEECSALRTRRASESDGKAAVHRLERGQRERAAAVVAAATQRARRGLAGAASRERGLQERQGGRLQLRTGGTQVRPALGPRTDTEGTLLSKYEGGHAERAHLRRGRRAPGVLGAKAKGAGH